MLYSQYYEHVECYAPPPGTGMRLQIARGSCEHTFHHRQDLAGHQMPHRRGVLLQCGLCKAGNAPGNSALPQVGIARWALLWKRKWNSILMPGIRA